MRRSVKGETAALIQGQTGRELSKDKGGGVYPGGVTCGSFVLAPGAAGQ